MKYRLYNDNTNNNMTIIEQVLQNRGIKNPKRYLNLSYDSVIPYSYLENIEESINVFDKHYRNKNCIAIIPDSDVDGYCSSAMIYNYIKEMDNNYPIEIVYHSRPKAHGLGDVVIGDNVKLLIIADAGTNDSDECEELKERGIDVIVLDHHEVENTNNYALIVNNQCSEKYTNKQLCGGGVVYRWLQALDDFYWNEFADNYLDLLAFSNISDVMDMRSEETRFFVNIGLNNIHNKFIVALMKAQDYSMNGHINIHNVQWYMTPVVNALLRIGSSEEKELLFRAFIETDESFEYKTRARKDKPSETIQESIYDRAARLSKNAKSRQDKIKEKCVAQLIKMADTVPETDKTIVLDTSDIVDNGLTGVIAIKIAEKYNKPCILLNKFFDKKSKKIP